MSILNILYSILFNAIGNKNRFLVQSCFNRDPVATIIWFVRLLAGLTSVGWYYFDFMIPTNISRIQHTFVNN